jgi:serine/threonine protein kinase
VGEELVGETVDTRYELRRLIAHGGMGLVFEAHHKFTRRVVALKLLPPDLRDKDEARGRLLREAHALTTVRHPGFVEALDAGVCLQFGPYLVLEMLDGRTLDGILAARRRLSVADTVQMGRQVCDALAHAHARGVIHRDLKPSNIFIARNEIGGETVKLLDLGVAAVEEGQLAQHDRKLTAAHEVLGTPEYMAPEQLWGRAIDARTDIYSIGMSLYECLTGDVPYTGAYPDVLVQVSNATAPPNVKAHRPDLPAALALVIESALEKDVANRFQSASELRRALVAASGLTAGPSALLSSSEDEIIIEQEEFEEPEEVTEPEIKLVKKKSGRPSDRPGAATNPVHRRHFVRAPYVTPVALLSPAGSAVEARSEEISEEGMLVLTPVAFVLGARITVRFASPLTGAMISLAANVRWTRDGRGKSAMGLEFEGIPPLVRRVIADYIATLPVSVETPAAQGA